MIDKKWMLYLVRRLGLWKENWSSDLTKMIDYSDLYEQDVYESTGNIKAAERIVANFNRRIQGKETVEPISRDLARIALAAREMRKPVKRSQFSK